MTPDTLGDYAITRLLGRGGQAEVYEGFDPDLDRAVAIKVILPAAAGEPGFEERFRREARMVASLRHPHIVQVFDFDVADGKPFMVMEYLKGDTLKARLAGLRSRGQTMPLAEIARILDALGSALDYAHGQGAIHRDIKPANILFTGQDEPVIVDFGIARLLSDAGQLTAQGQIVGTPAYMAPEQARGDQVDATCDQYALGVVLYEMATGRTPFQGESPTALLMQHVNNAPPPPRSLNADLPNAVQGVLLKALAKQPQQRFATVGDLATAFRQALAGVAVAPAAPVSPDAATLVAQAAAGPETVPAANPPPSQPAVEDKAGGGNDVLTGLLRVASVFAPLVGQESKPVGDTPRDRRSRLAAAMGAVGILLASLQLLAGAFDLVSRPAAVLGKFLPYLIAALLVGGAVLSVGVALRSPAPRRRRQASALLLLILLVGLVWGGYTAYDRLRPPEGFLVLIGDFDGANATRKGDFAGRIGAELIDDLRQVSDLVTVERSLETYADSAAAQAAGRKRKAGMVIWGAYDDFGVTPRIELLRQPLLDVETSLPQRVLDAVGPATAEAADKAGPSRLGDASYLTRAPLASTDLDLFVAHGPQQMATMVSAILATGLYADGQYQDALALFDKALANAEASGSSADGLAQVYFQRAMVRYALGQVEQVEADLERAVEIDPGLFAAHYNLAITYAGSCALPDALARAIVEAQTAVRLQPDSAEAHRLLGSLYQQAGRDQEALAALQAALQYDSQDALTYQVLASVHTAMGNEAEAAQASQQAIALHQAELASQPTDAYDTQLALGDAYVGAGHYEQAVAAYQAAAALKPDAAAPQRGLGNAHYWLGQLDQATVDYQQAARLAPQDPNAPLLAGLVQAQQGDLAGAIASQEAAARLSACDPAPHLLLGGLYFQQDDYPQAAAAYEAALALDPANADAWYVLGSLRNLQDDLAGAAEAAQQAVALEPDMVEAQRLLALARFDLDDAAGALPAAQALVSLEPQVAENHALLGDIFFGLQQWQPAAQAYEAALAVADDAATRIVLGLVRIQLGQVDAAVEQYQAALALAPDNALAWQSLGDAYAQQGQLVEAADAYQRSLAIADSALTRSQLANVYWQQGDVDQAIGHYEQAVVLDPTQPRPQVRLGGLYASQGRLAEAEAAYRAALGSDPENADALAGLAGAAYRQCSVNTAVQSMAAAAALAPGYRGTLAAYYEAQGRSADAAALYAELADAPAEDVFAHLAVADYLSRGDRPDEAAQAYQQILEAGAAAPGLVTSLIHYALGQIDYSQERLFAAGGEFEQALAAFPANVDAQAGLGDLALRAGDPAQALAVYDAALAGAPQYLAGLPAENLAVTRVGLHVRRSLALAQQGETAAAADALDQALALAEAAVNLTPRSPLAQFALAATHLARGESAAADVAFTRAGECDQSLLAARGRLEQGLASLQAGE
ncbi:MAG: tetratricopeptide repeat protein [Anaerolineae bacterium]